VRRFASVAVAAALLPTIAPAAPRAFVDDFGPSWSPDGKRIVFARLRTATDPRSGACCVTLGSALYVVNVDGGGLRRIAGSGRRFDPAWSPDGRWIAFTLGKRIWLEHPDGSGAHPLLRDTADQSAATWSPDGRRIAFLRDCRRTCQVEIVDRDGSHPRRVVSRADSYGGASWSPDGRRLVFGRDLDIWVVNVDGSHLRALTRDAAKRGAAFYEPAWSPDGKRIVFHSGAGLLVMNASGAFIQLITRSPSEFEQDTHPQWSPDGRLIVFSGSRGGSTDARIYVVTPDGRRLRRVTSAPKP
jgi:TolB protein